MRKLEKTISVEIFSYDESQSIERRLIDLATDVRLHAQAPYSNYWVGCSIVTSCNEFFTGCNVENVNWSETAHAEEVAITSAVAKLGPFRIKMMAVVGAPADQIILWPPITPIEGMSKIHSVSDICPSCGHCLQIIAENCFDEHGIFDPSIILLGYDGNNGEIYRTTIGDAYPMPFLPQHLGVNLAKDPRYKAR
jgi:cytidine deaminase